MSNLGIPQFIAGGVVATVILYAFNNAAQPPHTDPAPCPVPEPIVTPQIVTPQPQASSSVVLEGVTVVPAQKIEFVSFSSKYDPMFSVTLEITPSKTATSIREYVDASESEIRTLSRIAEEKTAGEMVSYYESFSMGEGKFIEKMDKFTSEQHDNYVRLIGSMKTILSQVPQEYKDKGFKDITCKKPRKSETVTCSLNLS